MSDNIFKGLWEHSFDIFDASSKSVGSPLTMQLLVDLFEKIENEKYHIYPEIRYAPRLD